MDEPHLAYFTIIDGTQEDVIQLTNALKEIKEKIPNLEFLVGNDKIQLTDLKYLLNELYKLYKRYKETKEKKLKETKR